MGAGGLNRLEKLRGMKSGPQVANAGGMPGMNQKILRTDPAKNINKGANQAGKNIFNAFNANLGQGLQGAFDPVDLNQLPAAPWSQDLGADRGRIEDSLYNKYTKNFDQEKTQSRDALSQQLAERGIAPGSGQLYENEMNRFDQGWNDRYDAAKQSAVQQGGQEWKTSFDIGSDGRGQAFDEQLLNKQLPLSQLGGLMGLANAPLGYKQYQQGLGMQQNQLDLQRYLGDQTAGIQRSSIANRGGGAPATTYLPPPPPPPGA